MRATLTRFAPAPTGWLHLGHVANALYVWGAARCLGARVLLRVEDHDRQRCRPEYEHRLLEELDWLGFEPDLFPTRDFRGKRCDSRQSDRTDIYFRLATTLAHRGLVYACRCSRKTVSDGSTPGIERPYPGTCRLKGFPLSSTTTWRVALDDVTESFRNLWCDEVSQRPNDQCGDPVIRDRHGNWTYQFAVCVDDYLQGVDLVVRGRDLLESTGRQIGIARLLGRARPATFGHHPLVMRSAREKLSKSTGDTSIGDLRQAGKSPAEIVGEAAHRVGLVSQGRPLRGHGIRDLLAEVSERLFA